VDPGPQSVLHIDRFHMSDIDSSIIIAIVLFAFLALAIDTLLTRVCPECRKRCRRDRSTSSHKNVKFYRCSGCQTLLVGSKPRD
jgi:hypothetical protein